MSAAIITEAGLSFLGLGPQPPTPVWGSMIAEGRNFIVMAPHVSTILMGVFSIGLGMLLWAGIGDTIRVSLSADPVEEVKVGYDMLKALGLRRES